MENLELETLRIKYETMKLSHETMQRLNSKLVAERERLQADHKAAQANAAATGIELHELRAKYTALQSMLKIAEDLIKVFTILPDPKGNMTLRAVAALSLDALTRIGEIKKETT